MVRLNEVRPGELAISLPARADAEVYFIGRIRTPWADRLECPRQGRPDGPTCRIEVFPPWDKGLDSIAEFERLEVLYWLHESRRDLAMQSPRSDGQARGVFSLRTPVRPNPIATSIVQLVKVEGPVLFVRGLDCLDGTPLIDLKPDRGLFKPLAPAQVGDFQVGDEP
jgi:tRNA-Thr(GGU) m(6)t(6)A37 methyltransferase TsaA